MARYQDVIIAILLLLPFGLITGCEFGKVDQGRVVGIDKDKGTVTFIRDTGTDSQNPEFTHLPALTYTLPTDPGKWARNQRQAYE